MIGINFNLLKMIWQCSSVPVNKRHRNPSAQKTAAQEFNAGSLHMYREEESEVCFWMHWGVGVFPIFWEWKSWGVGSWRSCFLGIPFKEPQKDFMGHNHVWEGVGCGVWEYGRVLNDSLNELVVGKFCCWHGLAKLEMIQSFYHFTMFLVLSSEW